MSLATRSLKHLGYSLALAGILTLNWGSGLLGSGAKIYAQTGEPLTIQGVELMRRGKQLNIRFLTTQRVRLDPVKDISPNLKMKTLVVKFKNAKVKLPGGKPQFRANDSLLDGIRFRQIGTDLWAQFKFHSESLTYSVLENRSSKYWELAFRPTHSKDGYKNN